MQDGSASWISDSPWASGGVCWASFSPGKASAAHEGAHRSRIEEIDPHLRVGDLGGIDADQHVERGLAGGIGAPVRHDPALATPDVTKMARPASERRSSGSIDRIRRQLAVTFTAITLLENLGLEVADRRERSQDAGIAQQHVEVAEALVERGAQPVDGRHHP